jgi:hypothetical protein
MKTPYLLPGSLRTGLVGLIALLSVMFAEICSAQFASWHIGRGGVTWDSQAETQIGAVSVEGSLQPLEIVPGENLTQLLANFGQSWQNGPPADFTHGGLPHTWSNSNFFNGLKGPLTLVDGDSLSSTEDIFKSSGNPAGTAFFFDLGAAFPINLIRFYPTPEDVDAFMEAFELHLNDGATFDGSRRPIYSSLRRVENNDEMVVEVDFATLDVRFIQLKNLSKAVFNLAEVEVYGQGFVPTSSYISELHLFDNPVNFGRLLIAATRLGDETIEGKDAPVCYLQLRSGANDTPLNYFRRDRETGNETEVSLNEFEKQLPRLAYFRQDPISGEDIEEVARNDYLALPVEEQGSTRDFVQGGIRVDSKNWSVWSSPLKIDASGDYEFLPDLPSPRSYAQFRVFFEGDAENTIRIDSFELEYAPLLASLAMGEVALASDPAPENGIVVVPAGLDTTFIYDISVGFDENGLEGFRGVKLEALPPPAFVGLEMGEPLVPVETFDVETTEDGFQVFFAPVDEQNNQPIRVIFRQKALEHNTPINAWLLGADGGLSQPVFAGNASNEVTTNALNIYTTDPASALRVAFSNSILTPNGDGINDATEIAYTMIQFTDGIQVDIDIFDLAGRRVRQLHSASQSAGDYRAVWDGRNDGDEAVPPGNYICLIKAESQARTFTTAKVVGVVY